ncbi:2-hydroxychromene-2-carboxylate isomerase, partial [Alloalcanivorax gelatiniphagus]
MSLQRRLMPYLARLLTSPGRERWRRRLLEARRRLRRRPHEAVFYFRIDDPYSLLMAQVLPAFGEHFGLRITPRVMLYLDANLYPEPDMLRALAPRDAAALAGLHGLTFPEPATPPDPALALAATRCLLKHEGDPRFWSLAHALGQALWADDQTRLAELTGEHGQQPEDQAQLALEARRDQFLVDGHYLTGTLHYQGEWYWSVERLDHLARRLEGLGLGGGPWPLDYGAAKRARPDRPAAAPGTPPAVSFSFPGPPSYLALGRAFPLACPLC